VLTAMKRESGTSYIPPVKRKSEDSEDKDIHKYINNYA